MFSFFGEKKTTICDFYEILRGITFLFFVSGAELKNHAEFRIFSKLTNEIRSKNLCSFFFENKIEARYLTPCLSMSRDVLVNYHPDPLMSGYIPDISYPRRPPYV